MEKETCEKLIPDYVLGKLSSKDGKEFLSCIAKHQDLQERLSEWKNFSTDFDAMDVAPSGQMDATFYSFLDEASSVAHTKEDSPKVKVFSIFQSKIYAPLIAASVMLLIGLFIGKQWASSTIETTNSAITDVEIQASKKETEDVRTQLVISLADQPSAARRLEAISESKKLNTATDKVIEALFKMLNHDQNVNVRLAAVTSLSKYVDNPIVREGLVMSIIQQDSPHVQIALADLMVTLKEKESINSIEQLLDTPNMDAVVKQKLQESINQII